MWLCTLPSIWPLLEEKKADVWTNFLHATHNSGVHTPLLLEGNKAPKPGSANPQERLLLYRCKDFPQRVDTSSSSCSVAYPGFLLHEWGWAVSLDLGCKAVLVTSNWRIPLSHPQERFHPLWRHEDLLSSLPQLLLSFVSYCSPS